VKAAQRLADTAKDARAAECGNGDPKQRGQFCRNKEDAEAIAVKALTEAQENKGATDRFEQIEVELKSLRGQKGEGSVGSVDPLRTLLAAIMGKWAELLTAWQKAVFAVIYDICLIAVMMGIEVLGHTPAQRSYNASAKQETVDAEPEPRSDLPTFKQQAPPRPKLVATSDEPPFGQVVQICTDAMEPARGKRVEIADLHEEYAIRCKARGLRAYPPVEFAARLETKRMGIRTKAVGSKVYLLDVQLVQLASDEAREADSA
jgi:hypothetical protein